MKFTLSWLKDHLDTSAALGLDRIAMLKYGIPGLRWLRHYGFKALQIPTLVGGRS